MTLKQLKRGLHKHHPSALLTRIRAAIIGRVFVLALSVLFSAVLSLLLLPFATSVLDVADYGAYAILISAVTVGSAAIDGGAGIIMPASYSPATSHERARLFGSVAIIVGVAAFFVGLAGFLAWTQFQNIFPASHLSIATAAILLPIRALTLVSTYAFSVTGRLRSSRASLV